MILTLTSELTRCPQRNATFGIGTQMSTTFEFEAKLRRQDEATFDVQRVLKLANEPEHFYPFVGSPLSPTSWHITPFAPTSRQFFTPGRHFRRWDVTGQREDPPMIRSI
jgi:hypothetical protein